MSAEGVDAALDALLVPFATGALDWPRNEAALFLGARSGAALDALAGPALVCEQSFRPAVDLLQQAGRAPRLPVAVGDVRYPLVMVLPPRQRDEARSLLARAVDSCAAGGTVVACMPNDAGARSSESDLKALAGLSGSLSKYHCRVYWAKKDAATINTELLAAWRTLDEPRPILGGRFVSRPGVFAWDRIDQASALLAQNLPASLVGHAADLGCGYGYLSVELLQRCPGVTALDLYEADARALELARLNLAATAPQIPLDFHWHDVTRGLPRRYDLIICNPPFHAQGSMDRPDIGRAFIAAAAEALLPGGRLWLVANRHLPYESVLDARFGSLRMVTQAQGFKVVEARKAGGARV